MKPHFYITTPIYYVNDKPHIGHAYTSVACDVLARFKRLDGQKVKFLTGTDEHGQKVEKSAKSLGITPQAMADKNSAHFREMSALMGISNDDFIRTTEARHKRAAQALWKKMQDAGHIYLGKYAGWYAVRDEAYYAESELAGGKAPTGADVEWVEEPSYFFKLSAFSDQLLAYFEQNPDFVGPNSRFNEVKSFIRGGLKDLSISRTTFSWGIPVPGDEKHIMYVWLDALANYLSALGYPENTPDFKTFWPADVHIVGKDILRFHAVYWPAFLMAAGLPLPKRIFAHGWWTIEGEKISKSLGNAIPCDELVKTYGLDQTRWFMMREVPFGNDGNFSREALVARVNSELANNIGNLVQRTLSMIQKNCGGKVPGNAAVKDLAAPPIKDLLEAYYTSLNQKEFSIQDATDAIVSLANHYNSFVDTMAPWKLKKESPEKMEAVLYVMAEAIRKIAIILQPFAPDSSSKILDQLGIPIDQRTFFHIGIGENAQGDGAAFALKPGTPLPPPEPAFPRLTEFSPAGEGGL